MKPDLNAIRNSNVKVITIPNNGSMENMSNQCFWISILQYLNTFPHIDLTLKSLRNLAELNTNTEHIMFDNTNRKFRNAVNKICDIFNIQIICIPVDSKGFVLYNGNIIAKYGDNLECIYLANYGLYHFEFIVDIISSETLYNNNFEPLIYKKSNSNLVKLKEIENYQDKEILLESLFSVMHKIDEKIIKNVKNKQKIKNIKKIIDEIILVAKSDFMKTIEKIKFINLLLIQNTQKDDVFFTYLLYIKDINEIIDLCDKQLFSINNKYNNYKNDLNKIINEKQEQIEIINNIINRM